MIFVYIQVCMYIFFFIGELGTKFMENVSKELEEESIELESEEEKSYEDQEEESEYENGIDKGVDDDNLSDLKVTDSESETEDLERSVHSKKKHIY